MGLSPRDLEEITPYQYNLMREGYVEGQRFEWERTRFQAYWTYRMNVSGDAVSIQEFLPLTQTDSDQEPTGKADMANLPQDTKDYLKHILNPDKYDEYGRRREH